MKIRVNVMLKEGVLDPQGKAIGHALEVLGFSNVGEVRVGKTMELDLAVQDRNAALAQGEAMAQELLANLVIENFSVEVVG